MAQSHAERLSHHASSMSKLAAPPSSSPSPAASSCCRRHSIQPSVLFRATQAHRQSQGDQHNRNAARSLQCRACVIRHSRMPAAVCGTTDCCTRRLSGGAVHCESSQPACCTKGFCSAGGAQGEAHQVQHDGPLHAHKGAGDASFGADGQRRMHLRCGQLDGAHGGAVQGRRCFPRSLQQTLLAWRLQVAAVSSAADPEYVEAILHRKRHPSHQKP